MSEIEPLLPNQALQSDDHLRRSAPSVVSPTGVVPYRRS
jgi:hypothetical protein